jgi:hypothetical protein
MNWKSAGKERVFIKKRNFPGFYPKVGTLKESQDNGCSVEIKKVQEFSRRILTSEVRTRFQPSTSGI